MMSRRHRPCLARPDVQWKKTSGAAFLFHSQRPTLICQPRTAKLARPIAHGLIGSVTIIHGAILMAGRLIHDDVEKAHGKVECFYLLGSEMLARVLSLQFFTFNKKQFSYLIIYTRL